MRVAFAGTPEFARLALQALHAAGFEITLVLTQPDRPAGRGLKLQPSPVKQFALEHGMAVVQPRSLRLDGKFPDDARGARQALEQARADVMVVAAYGLILPEWVLKLPPLGCLNIHASLLPRWRGAAPIHRAIEAGDEQAGVTIMQMDAGLDTGDMLIAQSRPIDATDTTGTLHDRLAVLGARLIVEALELAACGGLVRTPQPLQGVSYAHKVEKAEAQIDWAQPAQDIGRRVRAFNPAPGAVTLWQGEALKIWQAAPHPDHADSQQPPGTVLACDASGLHVQCGRGVLVVTELQRAGGKRLPVAEFVRGQVVPAGVVLGS